MGALHCIIGAVGSRYSRSRGNRGAGGRWRMEGPPPHHLSHLHHHNAHTLHQRLLLRRPYERQLAPLRPRRMGSKPPGSMLFVRDTPTRFAHPGQPAGYVALLHVVSEDGADLYFRYELNFSHEPQERTSLGGIHR